MLLRTLLFSIFFFSGWLYADAPYHAIGDLQGRVKDTDDAQEHHTPINGKVVRIQGVVHTPTLSRNRSGLGFYGFFIQNRKSQADGDEWTSDAVFVDLGRKAGIPYGEDRFFPVSGDELILEGTVVEHFKLTALQKVHLVEVVAKVGDAENLDPIEAAYPPDDIHDAARYWERREGMLMSIESGAIVQAPRKIFHSSQDSEIWLLHPAHPVATRSNVFERRVFRDAHPLDDEPLKLEDNENGFRLLIGPSSVKAAAQNSNRLLPPVRTFDLLAKTLQGAVVHAFGKYAIHPEAMPVFSRGPDPSTLSTIDRTDGADRVVVYNLQNLFDYRDDPHDPNDFRGNVGANGVRKPFDYVPETNEEYQTRIAQFAKQIVEELESPEIMLLQEVEDQDIGGIVDGEFVIDPRRQGNGLLDVLEELAQAVKDRGGADYVPAADRDGVDYRGIICAYLIREDAYRLDENLSASMMVNANPALPDTIQWTHARDKEKNPIAFNGTMEGISRGNPVLSRGLQVVRLQSVQNPEHPPLYVMNCHLSSGPGRSIERRTAQASMIGALCQHLMTKDPQAQILAGGDYNVFPRPDEPVVGEPSDQLGPLYDTGMMNAYDRHIKRNPQSAYTYVYSGQAGTLDQLFYSPNLNDNIILTDVLHLNSDWTPDPQYPSRAVSDHDPVVVDFRF